MAAGVFFDLCIANLKTAGLGACQLYSELIH